ncbi:class I SAM-dependent methyltransferase [Bacillus sp. SCS-153A]|uniref:class I SAM-dependent methyltransferase n=1 Tax=Rossellomorea sedimentorum TaxID=3115294 RepID=UPI003905FC28
MLVTTAGRTNNEMIEKAKGISEQLELPYIHREKRTVKGLRERYSEDILVVGKERLELFSADSDEPFFFHPNSASFRIKRILKGEEDPFIQTTGLKTGMRLLDCTMGMASDSIIASHAVGPAGKVIGIEASKAVFFIIKEGLKKWDSGVKEMDEAMGRIEAVHSTALDFLKSAENDSMDVVYFDPMFGDPLETSAGINPLRKWAYYNPLDEEIIEEAKRVAKHRVVLKEHYDSPMFEKLGFKVERRPSAKFQYGSIEVNE